MRCLGGTNNKGAIPILTSRECNDDVLISSWYKALNIVKTEGKPADPIVRFKFSWQVLLFL